MSQYSFGAGVLWGVPLTDATGTAVTNPTPSRFGALQNVSIDFSSSIKELHGSQSFALAVGRGKSSVTGKAQMANISSRMYNNLYFGQTLSNGIYADYFDTTGTAIPGTPYQITPTVPSSGTWATDLGVTDANGVPYVRVTSSPTTGQYSVAAGVYTFAAADTTNVVFISFQYTATSTSAKKIAVANVTMGYAPTFRADFLMPYNGKNLTLSFGSCISSKLSFPSKLDDFMISDFEFSAFADSNGNICTIGTSE